MPSSLEVHCSLSLISRKALIWLVGFLMQIVESNSVGIRWGLLGEHFLWIFLWWVYQKVVLKLEELETWFVSTFRLGKFFGNECIISKLRKNTTMAKIPIYWFVQWIITGIHPGVFLLLGLNNLSSGCCWLSVKSELHLKHPASESCARE
jgi:hypothetical protein